MLLATNHLPASVGSLDRVIVVPTEVASFWWVTLEKLGTDGRVQIVTITIPNVKPSRDPRDG